MVSRQGRNAAIAFVVGVAAFVSVALGGDASAQMVNGDVEAGRKKAEVCVACHGANGNAADASVPSLAGQVPLYTYYQLIQFREGRRVDPRMTPFVAKLTDDDMQDLAVYYAGLTPTPGPAVVDRAKAEDGWRASGRHHCESCHRPRFVGQNQVPRLSALSSEYLVRQLRGYKAQTRADTDFAMTMAAQPLSEADIEGIAHYIAALARTP